MLKAVVDVQWQPCNNGNVGVGGTSKLSMLRLSLQAFWMYEYVM